MADDKYSEAKLLEISKEAHKLTQMINSWPKAPNFDGRSKDITKDLMRGAFDLQESLITLRSLQETSNVKSHKNAEVGQGEVGFGILGSRRFERLAMDGSLFHYIEGLKKVVRESNCSQQHPSTVSDDGGGDKVSSGRKSLGVLMSSDHNGQTKKTKGPSLVAKLMGLEEECPTRREQNAEERSGEPRSILAIEMPKTRKLASMRQNPEPRTKTAKDIVEVVKSKEASASDETNEHKRMSCSGSRFANETPANVMSSRTPQLETVCDNGEMLARRTNGNETKNMKRNKTMPCQKTASLAPAGQEQRRIATISTIGKIDQGLRPLVNRRKTRERKELKATTAPKSQVKLGATTCKLEATKTSSNDRFVVSKRSNASRRHNPTSRLKPRSLVFTDTAKVKRITEAKPARKSMDGTTVTSNATCEGVNETDGGCGQSSTPCNIGRECNSTESKLFCEPMVKTSKGYRSSRSADVATGFQPNETINRGEAKMSEAELQEMFLSSRSFIRRAQEILGLYGRQAIDNQSHGILELGSGNVDLLLDCAKESMIRRRHQLDLSGHKMMQTCFMSLAVGSLDQLVDEISSGIGELTGYSRDAATVSLKDGVYVRMERDLRCKDMTLNAMWDVGWVNWICVEEADTAVGEVEERILHGLVEELVVELVYA